MEPKNRLEPLAAVCGGGRYGSEAGLGTADCSGPCARGHYCPDGSTSPTQHECGGSHVFCPEASPAPLRTLDGFRARYKYHLEDAKLRQFLAHTPVFATWDDHEIVDDWGAAKLQQEGKAALLDAGMGACSRRERSCVASAFFSVGSSHPLGAPRGARPWGSRSP